MTKNTHSQMALPRLFSLWFACLLLSTCDFAFAQPYPKVSAIYWGKVGSDEDLRSLSRFGLVIVGQSGDINRVQRTLDEIRVSNARISLGIYTVLVEFWQQPSRSDANNMPILEAIERNDWWLLDADKKKVQWSQEYSTYLVNITTWTKADSNGRHYPEWLARHKSEAFRKLSGLDYVFIDNVWTSPRPRTRSMLWDPQGTARESTDPLIQRAFRQGIATYAESLRKALPKIKLMANADNDLGSPEYRNLFDGAYIECAFGRRWSLEGKGWLAMMDAYRRTLENTRSPHDVILEACGESTPDLRLMRYGLVSAMLEDGWFGYKIKGVKPAFFADEYSVPIGTPIEPPPRSPSTSGIWTRRFSNGIVLVNPTDRDAQIDLEAGYRRFNGKQDPETNSGQPVRTVVLRPKDGIILLRH